MKTFNVKFNDKTYKVEAENYKQAIARVKLIACKDAYYIAVDFRNGDPAYNGYIAQKGRIVKSKNEALKFSSLDIAKKEANAFLGAPEEGSHWKIVNDSFADEAPSREMLQQLLDDETAAIGAYEIAIKNEDGKLDDKAIAVLKAIRDDEIRHRENLNAIMAGNVTEKNLEDSVNDDIWQTINDEVANLLEYIKRKDGRAVARYAHIILHQLQDANMA